MKRVLKKILLKCNIVFIKCYKSLMHTVFRILLLKLKIKIEQKMKLKLTKLKILKKYDNKNSMDLIH